MMCGSGRARFGTGTLSLGQRLRRVACSLSAGQGREHPHLLPHPAFPPSALQNVETFGSFLGEEIVSNWRRSLERTILSQGPTGPASGATSFPQPQGPPSGPQGPPVGPAGPGQGTQGPMPPPVGPPPTSVPPAASEPPPASVSAPHQPPAPSALRQPSPSADGVDPKAVSDAVDAVDLGQDEERVSHASSRPGSASPAPPRSTPSASTPVNLNTTTTTPASSPHAPDRVPLPPHLLVNGSPKSPSEEGGLCSNNNTLSSNNNLLSGAPGLLGPHNGLFMGPVPLPGHAHSLSNLLRDSDALKSPFRFDEQRSPFRFSEDRSLTPNGVMMGRLGESLIPKGDPMEARLQEMLRYNMDKYANQNLDTLNIARRVRELLSIHNIGQRLFAKYVLGLSQGTVSELLSKPKPWDKLTEKGRDSYRKMHAWACDEHSVMLLKSLIPKKGKCKYLPAPFQAPRVDSPQVSTTFVSRVITLLN